VTEDLPAWFGAYNRRQTIEAGIKETKQVFYLNRLKVRSEPAIYVQEAMTIFAANFIRWSAVWIKQRAKPAKDQLQIEKNGHQASGPGAGAYFGKSHPKFRRYVVKIQSSQFAGR